MYTVFTRTWWRENNTWPNGLEPHVGKRKIIVRNVPDEETARSIASVWNNLHEPGRLSLKAEYCLTGE